MSAILNLIYREYCRARLAEMRKQLLLAVPDNEIPPANSDASDARGPNERSRGLDNDIAPTSPESSGSGIGSVSEPTRYLSTSGASPAT